jgi:hypothetical protein
MTPDLHARIRAIESASGLRIGPIRDLAGGAEATVAIAGCLSATLTVHGATGATLRIDLAGTPRQIGAMVARLKHERAVA